ncbi:MAG TPA: amidohydrolase family protein, partial [Longimicrobiales bacterium]|nr:amidohydrolase family protein [Longimicrobiales bacterium]
SPGFIDPHTHAQGDLGSEERAPRENLNYLMQGVTTVVVGNDGHGTFDVAGEREKFDTRGIGTNAAILVGFGAVRGEVLGMQDRAPDPAELDRMRALVDQAMRDGAVGLSTGLFYAPQSFSTTDEVVELAKVAARWGGTYDSHLRDESSYTIGLLGSVREAIDIGRAAGIPVNISHIKALGVDVWGQADSALALIRAARAEGLRVTADQYPYEASGSSISASLLPRWAQAGGSDSLMARIADPATRARLEADMRDNLRRRNGPGALLITGGRDATLRGKTLEQVAEGWGVDPVEAAIRIVQNGGAGVGTFNMSLDDLATFMKADFVMTGSDGSGGHPRKYGTFPRKMRQYVLDDPVLSMERMIQASSAQAAEVFGLEGRGRIAEGAFADVVVFDPLTIRDEATFLEPTRLATGMRYVLVNGVLAVDEGVPTRVLAGRTLRRGDGRPVS